MPLIGWVHPATKQHLPLEDLFNDTYFNGRAVFPPWAARAHALKEAADVKHQGLAITATTLLGCPREVFIERMLPYYIYPKEMFIALKGTGSHDFAANNYDPRFFMTEANDRDRARLSLKGQLFGMEVTQTLDAIRFDELEGRRWLRELIDLKFPNDWSVKWRKQKKQLTHGDPASPEYYAQLNMGRILLPQQKWIEEVKYDPENIVLTVLDHACTSGKDDPLSLSAGDPANVAGGVPYLSEKDMLTTIYPYARKNFGHGPPAQGAWHLGNIVDCWGAILTEWDSVPDVEKPKQEVREEVASRIPLAGKPMMGGQKCEKWCRVAKVCKKLVRDYGEPQ